MPKDKPGPNFLYYHQVTSYMQTKGNVSEMKGRSRVFKIEKSGSMLVLCFCFVLLCLLHVIMGETHIWCCFSSFSQALPFPSCLHPLHALLKINH